MFVFGNLFSGIATVLDIVLNVYFWVIFARAILSWIRPDPYNPIVKIIYGLVDPVTYRISKIIPTRIGMIDMAPFLLMLLIILLQKVLVKTLFDLGAKIQLP
jgi:YggT family protein